VGFQVRNFETVLIGAGVFLPQEQKIGGSNPSMAHKNKAKQSLATLLGEIHFIFSVTFINKK
jgi:hypothetical protein